MASNQTNTMSAMALKALAYLTKKLQMILDYLRLDFFFSRSLEIETRVTSDILVLP